MKIKIEILSSLFCCGFLFSAFSLFAQNEIREMEDEIFDIKKMTVNSSLDSNQQLQLSKQLNEMKAKYDRDKKEQMIKLLAKDKEIQMLELERQKTIRNYILGGFLLVLIFSLTLIYFFLKEKRALEKLKKDHEQNQKILESFNN